MAVTETPPRTPNATDDLMRPARGFLSLGFEAKAVLIFLFVISVWVLAIFTFGPVAFVWPMKIIVPTMMVGLVLLTWGLI